MKRECSQNCTDMRNISTINGVDKRDYSTFVYALNDYIKKFEWYAFGKTPLAQANRVAEIASKAKELIGTDFSRMDGRIGPVPRHLEHLIMMKLFHVEYHEQLHSLMRSQVNLKGYTKNGVEYMSGDGRLSGSPETSAFNTIVNAFVAYCALRMTRDKTTNKFLGTKEAWGKLGIYGGDDGLSADISEKVYTAAAKAVGQVLTCEVTPRGETGVKFLARLYGPEVWHGNNSSMCDLPRTMSKFHTTVHLPESISAEDKLIDKAYALSLSDGNTPLVGNYVKAVLRHKPRKFKFQNYSRKWMVEQDVDQQYPNEPGDWMEDIARDALPEFSYGQFNDWVNGCSTLSDLMQCPGFQPAIEAKPLKMLEGAPNITMVNGEVIDQLPPVLDEEPTPMQETPVPVVLDAAQPASSKKRFRPRKKKSERPNQDLAKAKAGTRANAPVKYVRKG